MASPLNTAPVMLRNQRQRKQAHSKKQTVQPVALSPQTEAETLPDVEFIERLSRLPAEPALVDAYMEAVSPLCKLLTDQGYTYSSSNSTPRSRMWVLRMFSDMLDLRRHVMQDARTRKSAAALRPPAFVLYTAVAKWGAAPVAGQRCWDFYHGLQRYRALDRTAELALLLVDEALDANDLDFVATCRALVIADCPDPTDLGLALVPADRWMEILSQFFDPRTSLQVMERIRLLSTTTEPSRPPQVSALMFIEVALSVYRFLQDKPPLIVAGFSGDENFFWRMMPMERKADACLSILVAEMIDEVADTCLRDARYERKKDEEQENIFKQQARVIQEMRAQVLDLQAELEKKDDGLFKAEQRALAETERRAGLEKENSTLRQHLHDAHEAMADTKSAAEHLQAIISEREEDLQTLQSQLDSVKQQASSAADTASDEIQRLQQEVDKERMNASAARADADASRAEVAALQEQNSGLREAISEQLQRAREEREAELAKAQQLSEESIAALKKQLETVQQQAQLNHQSATQTLSADFQDQLSALQTELAEAKRAVQLQGQTDNALAEKIQELEKQNKTLQTELVTTKQQAAAKVDQEIAQTKALKRQLQIALDENEQLKKSTGERSAESEAAVRLASDTAVAESKTQMLLLQQELNEKQQFIESLKERLSQLEGADFAEVDMEQQRETQELIQSLENKCQALVAQREVAEAEKDSVIEELEAALEAAQHSATQEQQKLRTEIEEQFKEEMAKLQQQHSKDVSAFKVQLLTATSTSTTLEKRIKTLEAQLAQEKAIRAELEQQLAQERAERRALEETLASIRRSRSEALVGETQESSPAPLPSRASFTTPTSVLSEAEEDREEAAFLRSARFDVIDEVAGAEFAADEELYFTLHLSPNDKSIYKSDTAKKGGNPKWGSVKSAKNSALQSADVFYMRIWGKKRLSRDVLICELPVEMKQLQPFNPFAIGGLKNIVVFTIRMRPYCMPRGATVSAPQSAEEEAQSQAQSQADDVGSPEAVTPTAAPRTPGSTPEPTSSPPGTAAGQVTTVSSPLFRRRRMTNASNV